MHSRCKITMRLNINHKKCTAIALITTMKWLYAGYFW
jgi:hypothetical protein